MVEDIGSGGGRGRWAMKDIVLFYFHMSRNIKRMYYFIFVWPLAKRTILSCF